MEKFPKEHISKNCYSTRFGYLLEEGDILRETDLYDSTGGGWEFCPIPGGTLGPGSAAIWVRPITIAKFTQDMKTEIEDLESSLKLSRLANVEARHELALKTGFSGSKMDLARSMYSPEYAKIMYGERL